MALLLDVPARKRLAVGLVAVFALSVAWSTNVATTTSDQSTHRRNPRSSQPAASGGQRRAVHVASGPAEAAPSPRASMDLPAFEAPPPRTKPTEAECATFVRVVGQYFKDNPAGRCECPADARWFDLFRAIDPSPNKRFVNIGCNKGGDVAGFLHRWDPSFKASDWAALARTAFTRVRGACGQLGKAVLLPPSEPNSSSASATEKQQCPRGSPKWGCSCQDLSDAFGVSGDIRRAITFRYPKGVKDFWLEHKCDTKPRYATSLAVKPLPPPGAVSEEGTHGTRPIAYCVELMPKTARALEKIHAGLPAADQRLVVVDNYAVGSGNPAVVSVADVEAGVEYFGIDARRGGSNNVKVPHVTLDGYSQAKHLLDGPTPIDFVLVDTEGNDPLVLQGGNATLRRARFVAFENHRTGVWSRTPLRSVIDLMDTHGFDCFWTANDGTLWEVTGCYPFVNYKGWSNIGCAKRGDELLKALKILADTNGGLP